MVCSFDGTEEGGGCGPVCVLPLNAMRIRRGHSKSRNNTTLASYEEAIALVLSSTDDEFSYLGFPPIDQ